MLAKGGSSARLRRWGVLVGAAALVGLIWWLAGVSRWAEIRTDTGDLRFCFLGIPYEYVYHRKPRRELLYQAAQVEPAMTPEWLKCGDYPDHGYWYCWDMYRRATAWWSVDPRITRLIMDDLGDYIRRIRGLWGGEEAWLLTWSAVSVSSGVGYELPPNWRERPMVREYLIAHGFESALAEE